MIPGRTRSVIGSRADRPIGMTQARRTAP